MPCPSMCIALSYYSFCCCRRLNIHRSILDMLFPLHLLSFFVHIQSLICIVPANEPTDCVEPDSHKLIPYITDKIIYIYIYNNIHAPQATHNKKNTFYSYLDYSKCISNCFLQHTRYLFPIVLSNR